MKNVVVFTLEKQKYALPCSKVEKIINAVAITPLPHAPQKILGIINVHGKIIAVTDIRRLMELTAKSLELSDKIIITKTKKRLIAFIVDGIEELAEIEDDRIVNMKKIMSDPDVYDGTIKIKDGLILIYNAEKFLSLDEEEALDKALTIKS
jgi:purine-binding chemotaxis protein CheW